MKLFVVFAFCVIAASALEIPTGVSNSNAAFEPYFVQWMKEQGKSYRPEEYNIRLNNFRNTYSILSDRNAEEQSNAEHDFGPFADLSEAEFEEMYLTRQHGDKVPSGEKYMVPNDFVVSDADVIIDWRDEGAVTPVQNQGRCGSCWAFCAITAVEGVDYLNTGELKRFSEQQPVDCDKKSGGCRGGFPWYAYDEFIEDGGVNLDEDYPYQGSQKTCRTVPEKFAASFTSWFEIDRDEDVILAALQETGPIAVGMNASKLSSYRKGIYNPKRCSPKKLNHCVTLVGAGNEDGTPYWLVKNSWGTRWGEDGYFRILRGDGTCGINVAATQIKV